MNGINSVYFEHFERLKTELEGDWELESLSGDIPQQDNSSDCGVFSCKFADYISLGYDEPSKFNFKARNMPSFRKLICYYITKGELPVPSF